MHDGIGLDRGLNRCLIDRVGGAHGSRHERYDCHEKDAQDMAHVTCSKDDWIQTFTVPR